MLVEAPSSLLTVNSLVTGYGNKQVLNGVSLRVGSEVVAVIGHNGAGKSTLLKAVFGLLPIWKGQVWFNENELRSIQPRELLRMGLAYVPQGNRVFTDLTVHENLELGAMALASKALVKERIDQVFTFFPLLRARLKQRAGTLSGGERQMLALGSSLVLSPRMLLLDEPSLGLAPNLVSITLNRIRELNHQLGVGVLIVEQKVREVLEIAQRVYVVRNGSITFSGPTDELADLTKLREVYL